MRATLLCALLVAACGGEPMATPDLRDGTVAMVLGGAVDGGAWTDLTDGQDVTLVEGAQGGFHVWMKFRVRGMAPGKVLAAKDADRARDDAPVLRSQVAFDVGSAGNDGWWELPMATPMFMCPTPIGVGIVGEKIVYRIDLVDEQMRPLASQKISLVPHCPTENEAFCMRICTG